MLILDKIIACLHTKKIWQFKKSAAIKVNILPIYLENFLILPIFDYKKLFWKIRYFTNQLQKKVQVLLISSGKMYLCSQLGGGGILFIHNQTRKNPVFFFFSFFFNLFMCDFSKENTLFTFFPPITIIIVVINILLEPKFCN